MSAMRRRPPSASRDTAPWAASTSLIPTQEMLPVSAYSAHCTQGASPIMVVSSGRLESAFMVIMPSTILPESSCRPEVERARSDPELHSKMR
ncbi:hypothetical protein SB00610_03233 [Klebsiella quasipneumoniae subsp. similipneumoniae]|nr:hypothetical protein SB00610_03233 [Klebsiella quasipneumoniae subsp. similipneumoniae]